MAEERRALPPSPGQASAPGNPLPVPMQGIPDVPLLEAASAANEVRPDMTKAAGLIGQMMSLAAQLAIENPVFVGPMDDLSRSLIARLGFANQQNTGPSFGPPLSGLPPLPTTPLGPQG